jgi:hypothetical protein
MWESQVWLRVTKQCTWAQSGTAWQVVNVLGVEAAEVLGAAGPLPKLMWGSGTTRSCSRDRRASDTLNSLEAPADTRIPETSAWSPSAYQNAYRTVWR